MNVKEIIAAYLKVNGFDGLCSDSCGCGLDDLMPCDGYAIECEPSKKHVCDGTCRNCCATNEEVMAGAHNCYRPAATETENEDTHL